MQVLIKEAKNIKETRTTAIASNFNSTFVKTLSFDRFELRPPILLSESSKAQFRSWATCSRIQWRNWK